MVVAAAAPRRDAHRYYPGKIAKVNGNGTCDVDYDDGEKEKGVAASLIKVVEKGSTAPVAAAGGAFKEGDPVEARYRGKSKYYPGKISRDRGDGTFDIDYDDGESESRVASALIQARGGAEKPKEEPSNGAAIADEALSRLRVGTKIEARYRGKSKFYPGVVARDNGDDTYDVDYDDGEKEKGVAAALIKLIEKGSAAPAAAEGAFKEGDRVEARYRGKSKHYPGKISRDRGDGTYPRPRRNLLL